MEEDANGARPGVLQGVQSLREPGPRGVSGHRGISLTLIAEAVLKARSLRHHKWRPENLVRVASVCANPVCTLSQPVVCGDRQRHSDM